MTKSPFSTSRPHPWHGLSPGKEPPLLINAYIEITPFDVIKYEIDKDSGYLRVDRPQRTSSQPPAVYGFIPRTYCGQKVAALSDGAQRGDGDPLDICVLSERPINRSEIIIPSRVVGGIQLQDRGEADDKIVAVLEGDLMWNEVNDLTQLPKILIERLVHYFATYKIVHGSAGSPIAVKQIYGSHHASQVVTAALGDYYTLTE